MNTRDAKVIGKVLEHIDDVKSFIGDMSYEEFLASTLVKNATAFSVAQIGELTTVLSDDAKARLVDIDWRGVKGFRNWIIHNYEKVDVLMFWDVVQHSLPEMEAILTGFLSEHSPNELQADN